MNPSMYETHLEEIRKDIELEIQNIARKGNFTTSDLEELKELIEFIETLPASAAEINGGTEWDLHYTS